MNVLTRYSFIATYKAEELTKQEATAIGIGSVDFSQCDTDGDGNITIDEILANDEVCSKIVAAINAEAKASSGVGEVQSEAETEAAENQLSYEA